MFNTSQRLVPFPAYSYAFIQRGVAHTRTFTAWVLFQKTGLELLRRPQAVAIICRRMRLTPKQARLILRRGNGPFWILVGNILYPQTPAQVTSLIRNHRLARYIKRSKFYVPEVALRNLGQLRAHLALPVISARSDRPTARAYTAKCLARHKNTISTYRRWLRDAGFISTQATYRRFLVDGEWIVIRGQDYVELTPANLFRVDKAYSLIKVKGEAEFGGMRYRFSPTPIPTSSSPEPRPPPSTQEFVRLLRQEVRVKIPVWRGLLSRDQRIIMSS